MVTYGRVIRYDYEAGFGYIEPLSGDLIYFHYTALKDRGSPPLGGAKVTYDLLETTRRLEATNIQIMPY